MDIETVAVRWGDGRRADSEYAREKILDAAMSCYQKHTFQKTRMEHIAREAKVSRTTLYRYFENRDELLMGVVVRAIHELVQITTEQVAKTESFAEFMVEMIAVTIDQVRYLPLFNMMMQEAAVVIGRIHTSNAEIFAAGSMQFKARFEAASAAGELRKGIEFEEFMNWVIHVGSTFVLLPSDRCDMDGVRQMLWRYLVPSVVREESIPISKRI